MEKIVYILLDAFRSDYLNINNTPFLFNLSKKGEYYKEVVPNLSYCERTEIFTGLTPKESGNFLAIGHDPENSPYKNVKYLNTLHAIENILVPVNRIRVYYRKAVSKIFKYFNFEMSSYNIPLNILKYFSLTEDRYSFFDKHAFNGNDSIFSYCIEKNINIFYDSFTSLNFKTVLSDDERLQLVLKNADQNYSLYLIYITLPDFIGHNYGPDSEKMMTEIQGLDLILERFINNFLKKQPKTTFILNGDHGMRSVTDSVNLKIEVEKIAKSLNLKLSKDYIYFLDSTMVRIWFSSNRSKYLLSKSVKENKLFNTYGTFINEDRAKKEKIPYLDRRYGDLLWVANRGVVVFPDYFHINKIPKGMHGYKPGMKEEHGTCIVIDDEVKTKTVPLINLSDVYSIIINKLKRIK